MADLQGDDRGRQVKLRAEMFRRGIRQGELAKSLGMTPATLSMITCGRLVPYQHEKEKIAAALGKNVGDLFD